MPTDSEHRLTTIPWRALQGLGPVLAPALEAILAGQPAERALDKLLRAHRDFSPEQRTVCAESLFGVGLWRRRLRCQLEGPGRLAGSESLDSARDERGSLDSARDERGAARGGLQLLAILARELDHFERAPEVLGVELPPLAPAPSAWRDRFSFPDWIGEHLDARFGDDAPALADALDRPGPVCLRARGDRRELQDKLAALGLETTPGRWASKALIVLTPRPNLLGLGPDLLGAFEVQDEGSQLLGELVDAHPGDEVLDLCAGAGGKSLQLAAIVGHEGKVHATDLDLPRLERLRTRAAKADARVLIHGTRAPESLRVSRVLVDAPCSELGALRRGPDLRWRLDPALVTSMPPIQRALIDTGLRHLAPGGRLVYATCTFTQEENEAVVDAALGAHPELSLVRPPLDPALLDSRGFLSVSPHRHGTDGFFAAVFTRRREEDASSPPAAR